MENQDFIRGKEIVFLDDPCNPDHRPHHIYHCNIMPDKISCLAKENSHGEGEKLRFFSFFDASLHPSCILWHLRRQEGRIHDY